MQTFSAREVEIFARGIPHPEGVVFDADGWLYTGSATPNYTDPGAIYRIAPDGRRIEKFADTGGRVLGLAFDRRGDLVVCDGKLGAVFRIEPSGRAHLFAERAGERKIRLPNFLVFDADGQLYVSDSGTAKAGERTGAIFRFAPDGAGTVFLDGLIFANGLALSAQGDVLYVVETRDDRVLRVPIQSDGDAGTPDIYVDHLTSGPDGLAVDEWENLYITVTRANQIVCIAPSGERVALVADPTGERIWMPSNLAFGPPHQRGLYIANLFGDYISRLVIDATR